MAFSDDIEEVVKKNCDKPLLLSVLAYVTQDGELYLKFAGYEIPGTREILQKELPLLIAKAVGGQLIAHRKADA